MGIEYDDFTPMIMRLAGNTEAMMRETLNEGLDTFRDTVQKFTPVDTGKLQKSIRRSKGTRETKTRWAGSVLTTVKYAKWVEYGTEEHIIKAKEGSLKFNESFPEEVRHPGAKAAHMFQRGAAVFAHNQLEPIMKKNLAKYMGVSGAAAVTTQANRLLDGV